MKIASIQGVVKRYGSYMPPDYVDLDIYEGEIIGLLGPNGAGKTALIQTFKIKEKLGLVTQEFCS